MKLEETELRDLFTTNHPARPYFVASAVACGLGLLRGGLSGVVMLTVGGAAFLRGVDELEKTRRLHGGNYHGSNAAPKMEDAVSMR